LSYYIFFKAIKQASPAVVLIIRAIDVVARTILPLLRLKKRKPKRGNKYRTAIQALPFSVIFVEKKNVKSGK